MSTENKYFPFNEEQFNDMKSKIGPVKDFVPDNLLHYIWNNYKLISGNVSEAQPCACGSSAGLWLKAVTVIKDYIKRVEAV
jgi:hypothetical protein